MNISALDDSESNSESNNDAAQALGKSGKSNPPKRKGKSKKNLVAKERFHVTHFRNPSGEEVFRVAGYQPNGDRVRENWKTMEEAIARKADLDVQAVNIVTTTASRLKATWLTDAQIKDAEAARARMDAAKMTDKTFYFAADHLVTTYHEPVRQITVAKAFEQFIAERKKQNRRRATIRNLNGRLGMFSKLHGQKNVANVTAEECRDFVFRKGTSPRNQINDRLAVSNFYNWCVRRQFAAVNHMAKVDKPAVDFLEPRTLTLADCRNLLVAAREYQDGKLLPYVILSLFAGPRPAEIALLTWDRIDLTEGSITLDGSMAKTRQRRIVKLPKNAVTWLVQFAVQRPPLEPKAFQRHFGRVKQAAGFNIEGEDENGKKSEEKLRPWVQDYMRHTAISMYLAKHKHEGEAASWAGNSPNVIHKHYKGLVKEADAKEYWKITPETVKSKMLKFPAQAAA